MADWETEARALCEDGPSACLPPFLLPFWEASTSELAPAGNAQSLHGLALPSPRPLGGYVHGDF